MRRAIQGYEQDDEGHFKALLSCGHTQHVRHQPPLMSRPWVLSEEGRESRLGTELECPYCDLPVLPHGLVAYRRTASFDENTIPAGLLQRHQTKAGVWGRIVLEAGKLLYVIEQQSSLPEGVRAGSWHLRPGVDAAIPPEVAHRVAPLGTVSFHVEFLDAEDHSSPPAPK